MLIPGCHEIYVCCACCLHGVVLSADEVPDGAGRFSMVTLTNENLIKGNLEEMMIDGISHIIDDMPERPKCVEGFTSCMQHFLHIDLHVVYDTLRQKYPDIDFIDGYMIPTLQRRFTPDILGRRQLVRAVQPLPKQKAVNYVVNYYPVDEDNELTVMLRQGGYAIHDFAACKTYEEYKAMGESQANIYFLENAGPAAKDMEKRLDQQALYLPYAYDYETLRRNLQQAAQILGLDLPDCDAYERAVEEKVRALKERVGDTHIAIDYTATPRPLGLAKFLLIHASMSMPSISMPFRWTKRIPSSSCRPTIRTCPCVRRCISSAVSCRATIAESMGKSWPSARWRRILPIRSTSSI